MNPWPAYWLGVATLPCAMVAALGCWIAYREMRRAWRRRRSR
jgi:hypothetical protein